jgi:uroporphyrinogen decarboxylase
MILAKEQAIRAFHNQKPDRVPVCAFLGGSWPLIYRGYSLREVIGDPDTTAQVFYEVNDELDADIVTVGAGATALTIRALGGEVRFDDKGAPSIVSELVTSEDELNRLNLAAALESDDLHWIRETAQRLFQLAGDQRLILASGRAPFTLAGQIFGLEKLAKAMYKNKSFVHRLLEFTTQVSIGYFQPMLEAGTVHGAFIADPSASGDVISKRHFEEFAAPYLQQVVNVVKHYNRPVMLHICGDITDRLDLVAGAVDCISLDSKVNITKAKTLVGHEICLAGNVDPVSALEFGTAETVQNEAGKCLEQGAGTGGFILMPGCDFGSQVTIANLQALVQTGHQWKG